MPLEMVDLEEAYGWLNHFEASNASHCTESLRQQMDQAYLRGDPGETFLALRRLENISRKTQHCLAGAEGLVECGRIAYRMGRLEQARQYLERAVYKYPPRSHKQAVAAWMMGFVLWSLPPCRHDEALKNWEYSISIFEELAGLDSARAAPSRPINVGWYGTQLERMCATLECAVCNNCAPSPPSFLVDLFSMQDESAEDAEEKVEGLASLLWPTFPIREEIPAGGFEAVGFDPEPIGYAELESDQVIIDGSPHKIFGLRSSKVVGLSNDCEYEVVKVKGNSMNQAGINDGDYVLLRIQPDADSNDIVLAWIFEEDSTATLKRFIRKGRKVILRPESDDPRHQEREFTSSRSARKDFGIRGIALAVFKPI